MNSSSNRLRRLGLFLLPFLSALAAGAQTPPAAPQQAVSQEAPEAIDAWGRTVNSAETVEAQVAANVVAKMGSPGWVPLAMRILQMERGILPRLYWSAGIDLQCGKRYKAANPQSTVAQYRKLKNTAEGVTWTKACIAGLLDDPAADPRLTDGAIASLEASLTVPDLLLKVREQRIEEGLDDLPEPTPEMEEALPEMAKESFASSACLVRKALEKEKLATLVTEPARLEAQVVAARKAGLCNSRAANS